MVSLPAPNPALRGKLVIIFPWPTSEDVVAPVRERFPNLEIIFRYKAWDSPALNDVIPDEEWKHVDFLLASSTLPQIELAPKIRFIQLVSSGANHIMNHPFFKETDVPICTANGVHA
jgi:hypothetical protein